MGWEGKRFRRLCHVRWIQFPFCQIRMEVYLEPFVSGRKAQVYRLAEIPAAHVHTCGMFQAACKMLKRFGGVQTMFFP